MLIDLIVYYLISVLSSALISIVPYLPNLFPQGLILTLLFMSRDYFFGGRGIGKNLMGLQVVQASSGLAPTLKQSWMRNITLTAPLLLLDIVGMLPGALLPEIVRDLLKILETIYALTVLPLESYRAYSREDSLRVGDVLAQTKIIQSQTNFDQLLPGQKN